MPVLHRSDLRRPRFFFGVLRQRMVVAAARRMGRMVGVRIAPQLPRLLVPASDLVGHFLREDEFEARERDFVSRVLALGDVFVDVGAHVGLYAILAGHRVGETGAVVAVEPNPELFAVLERNVARHGLCRMVRCVQVAASDEDGTAELHVPRRAQAAWSSLAPPAVGTARIVTVRTVTLGSLLGGLRPFLVKIDVEGWERRVLAGGQHLFAADDAPHLLVECFSGRAIAEDLARLGYDVYRYDRHRGTLDLLPRKGDEGGNLVASKHADELRGRLAAT